MSQTKTMKPDERYLIDYASEARPVQIKATGGSLQLVFAPDDEEPLHPRPDWVALTRPTTIFRGVTDPNHPVKLVLGSGAKAP